MIEYAASDTAKRRIAVVSTRYAPATYGGAERYAYALAAHLAADFHVELLCTTAHDYLTWENAYPSGAVTIDGVLVRRFRVDEPRTIERFDRLSERLMRTRHISRERQEAWMGEQGPLSLDLLRHLATEGAAYDAVIFAGYLYATTYFGLPLVAPRAVLVPLTHDEWAITLSMWDRIFALPRAIFYNTAEERAFTQRRFPALDVDGPVIGTGIEGPPAGISGERFRATTGIREPFVLYLGRIDASKGVRELLRSYATARHRRYRSLVLIGDVQMTLPPIDGVHAIGPVDEQTKWDALDACDFVVMPSKHESLSIVALEAWATGKALLANAQSDVLAGQIARSGGGVTYAGERACATLLASLDPPRCLLFGARGRAFVDEHYRWPAIEARVVTHLNAVFGWNQA